MRTIVKGKNFEVPEQDRLYAERKLQRLERMLDERSDAIVELSLERHRSTTDSHIVDVTLVIDGQTVRGRAAAPTHRAGVDEVLDKVERRAVDFRTKPRSRRLEDRENSSASGSLVGSRTAGAGVGRAAVDDDGRARVTKVKRFAIEPMFEEDAVARMEELGHSFFVFVDAETERIAILYRRQAGDFGLIEPVVGGGYTKGGPVRSRAGASAGDGRARR
ncbi:MAG TPA: ribosome-associated translation inhibitor RaiA [Candidatus Limnocylindrales bacterium]